MGATWLKWAIQLVLEELSKRMTPEVIKDLLSVALKSAKDGVAAAKVKAQATSNPWDDAAVSMAETGLEALSKALGVP